MKPSLIVLALALACGPTFAQAAPAEAAADATSPAKTPDASDLLFDQPQMKNVPPGSTLKYDYLRRSGITKGPYGPPLKDEITFNVEPGKAADNRTIRVQMFSGENRVPAGPFEDVPGNPVVALFLENHLKGLAALLEANPRYIKNAIRKALREKASITPTQVDYKGKQVPGWRIEAKPFAGDPQTDKLRGFDTLTYTFVTSPEVPGEIVSAEAQAQKADGGELLEEKLSYDQNAG